jgi:CHAT domain-containing protein
MTLNKENGFVNGLEISLLNLKETELVIISGCESGKATYGIGESKFGFKEALFRAGVKNVILSDYNIDDKATAEFYSTFYTILTDKKMSIEETLKETKKEMQKKYKHPYYWAAFQLYTN